MDSSILLIKWITIYIFYILITCVVAVMPNYCMPTPGQFSNVNMSNGYAVNQFVNGILLMKCNYGFRSLYYIGNNTEVLSFELSAQCTGYNNTIGAWNYSNNYLKTCARVCFLLYVQVLVYMYYLLNVLVRAYEYAIFLIKRPRVS